MLALGVAVGGGYGWARTVHMPRIVEIGSTACGLPIAGARFGVPLQAMLEAAGGLSFAIGPVEVPDGGGPITLRFEPSVDGAAHQVAPGRRYPLPADRIRPGQQPAAPDHHPLSPGRRRVGALPRRRARGRDLRRLGRLSIVANGLPIALNSVGTGPQS